MKTSYLSDDPLTEYGTVLKALKEEHIVEFSTKGGVLTVEECCDRYFYAELTKGDFAQMIRELQALYETMPEESK